MAFGAHWPIIILAAATLASAGLGCAGQTGLMDGENSRLATESYAPCTDKETCCGAQDCRGDPDEGMVCSCTGLWDCGANPRKCEQPLRLPPGEDGSWSCGWSASSYICRGTPSTPPASTGGWECRGAADGKTYECLLTPPNPTNESSGTAAWSCTVDNAKDKLVCERIDWSCNPDPNRCTKILPVPPGGSGGSDGNGDWSCEWSATSYVCKGSPSTTPTSGGGWSCRQAVDGKGYECVLPPPNPTNQPSGTSVWSCEADNAQDMLVCDKTDGGDHGYGDDSGSGDTVGGSQSCGGAEFEAKTRQIPDILILLDRSNSMSDVESGNAWPVITKAINEVVPAMDTSANFGLMVFPNSVGPNACAGLMNGCVAAQAPLVNVATGNALLIQFALAVLTTCGATPTTESLGTALMYLKSLDGGRPKYVLLATDGGPNCNMSLNPNTCTSTSISPMYEFIAKHCLDDQRAYEAVDALTSAGIKTYVLGMGGALNFSTVLNEMARRGGTGSYYPANNSAAIKDTLSKIAKTIALCEFHVSCGKIPNPSNVSFYFDGNVVARSTSRTDGWDWTDGCTNSADSATVQFFGAQCDAIMNNTAGKITANFCP